MNSGLQIAIDGPAASGKSTIAQAIAQKLDATYINTGEMYRSLTQCCMTEGIDPENETSKIVERLDAIDVSYKEVEGKSVLTCCNQVVDRASIRTPEITSKVSIVAKIPEVRKWMVERQRDSADVGLLVMEGRDIGTVVFPNAKWKFFLTASPEERARRRLAQDGEIPSGADLASVAKAIAERDEMDRNRKISPLKPADDAIMVDTTGLEIEQVLEKILSYVQI